MSMIDYFLLIILIILLPKNNIVKCDVEFIEIKKFPNSNNYFSVLSTGLYIYNFEYNNCALILEFNSSVYKINNNKIILSELEDENHFYFLTLVNKYLFLFDINNNKTKSFSINNNYNNQVFDSAKYYDFLPYKIHDSNISFFIVSNSDEENINFFYYNFSQFEIITNPKIQIIKLNFGTIVNNVIACQINPRKDYIKCFFNGYNGFYYFANQNFSINVTNNNYLTAGTNYASYPGKNLKKIKIVKSSNYDFFICILEMVNYFYVKPVCFIQKITENNPKKISCEFSNVDNIDYKVFYFEETNHFIYNAKYYLTTTIINNFDDSIISCSQNIFANQTKNFSIIYFNNEYKIINYLNFSNYGTCNKVQIKEPIFIEIKKISLNDNYFVVLNLGLYIYSSDLFQCSLIESFNSSIYKSNEDKIIIKELKEKNIYYIFCLVNEYLYIFNENNNNSFSYKLDIIDTFYKNIYYDILPYKNDNKKITFIIPMKKNSFKLYFYFYDFCLGEDINNVNYTSFDLYINYHDIKCLIKPHLSYINCFYIFVNNIMSNETYKIISELYFINNFNIINKLASYSLTELTTNKLSNIKIVSSLNGTNFICYLNEYDQNLYCYINEYLTDNMKKINCYLDNFDPNNKEYKLLYFEENNEFLILEKKTGKVSIINSITGLIDKCRENLINQQINNNNFTFIYDNNINYYKFINYLNFDDNYKCSKLLILNQRETLTTIITTMPTTIPSTIITTIPATIISTIPTTIITTTPITILISLPTTIFITTIQANIKDTINKYSDLVFLKNETNLFFSNNSNIEKYINESCLYYFYLDNERNHHCTNESSCPLNYSKLNGKECIKECGLMKKFEFQNKCYDKCPPGSIKSNILEYVCEITCDQENPFKLIKKQKCVDFCEISLIKSGECLLNYKEQENFVNQSDKPKIKENHEIEILNNIIYSLEKSMSSEKFDKSDIEEGNDIIIKEKNMIFTISSEINQKNQKNDSVTTIDLGECSKQLKRVYNIQENDTLFIKMIEIKEEGMKIPKTIYDVYYPFNSSKLMKLNLSYCEDIEIIISPVVELNENENLDEYNPNSGYYNDICYPVTSDSGTDITLKDRKNEFFKQNKTLCQDKCFFVSYNKINKKVICECEVEKIMPLSPALINIDKTELYNNFIHLENIMNIKILKCIKILTSFISYKSNYGFLITLPFMIGHFSTLIIFFINQLEKLKDKIKDIILMKKNFDLIRLEENEKSKEKGKNKSELVLLTTQNHPGTQKITKIKKIGVTDIDNNNIYNINTINDEKNINNIKIEDNNIIQDINIQDNTKSKIISFPISDDININNIKNKNIKKNKNSRKKNIKNPPIKRVKKKNQKNKQINGALNQINTDNINNLEKYNNNLNKSEIIVNENNNNDLIASNKNNKDDLNSKEVNQANQNELLIKSIMTYTNQELNDMDYNQALKYDHRTFCQFYISLIKTQHIIYFSFFYNDYNSKVIKMNLFLINFFIFLSINALFFNEDTMHNIYISEGKFDLVSQIPQMIYSTLISFVIDIILNFLALSESNILDLKNDKEKKDMHSKQNKLLRKVKIKITLYFIVNSIFYLFFGLYLSIFCAIYQNTQIHLIKDTLISYGYSLISPFYMYLITSLFRVSALTYKNKNLKFLYIISKLFTML